MSKDIDKLLDDFESDIDSVGKKKEPENLWGDTLDYIEKHLKPYEPEKTPSIWDSVPDFPKNRYGEDERSKIVDWIKYGRYGGKYPTIEPQYKYQHIITCDKCKAVFKVITINRDRGIGGPEYADVRYDRFWCVKCGNLYRVTGEIEAVEICNGEFRFDRTQ